MSVKGCYSPDESLPHSYSYDVDSADDASVCSEGSGICMSPGLGQNANPELKYSYRPTWNQGHRSYMHNPLGAVPYIHPVNTRWAPQPAPIVYSPPIYGQSGPSPFVSESYESENRLDQSPNDYPQVKTEHKNYFSPIDVTLNELRMADIQLQSEIRTGLNSQRATLSQSSGAVQKQLRQAQKCCDAIEKQLKIVDGRCNDRQTSAQEIKELRGQLMTLIKGQKSLRRCLKRERRKGARA
ncbi:hypothetical protein FPANT_1737 [Fusarium pseudoanthophilum]|uniref:Uncharacterized protein n=1 Tax=Fusarium pseudoanthophilum TaxID=48495 RepID=A0A8H5UW09_9HYPO|nr:hypothetical protein FPANT_1737 [Fusarium pseudoanthophilum]